MTGTAKHALTGRLTGAVAQVLAEEILEPQFRYETTHLLPWYVRVEKVLLVEYRRMELLSPHETGAIAEALDAAAVLVPDRAENFADISFALERFVEARLPAPIRAWHVDRSRNDLQATAQLLAARVWIRELAESLLHCAETAHRVAGDCVELIMPGYTHGQPAQVITPAFFLSALTEQLLTGVLRLARCHDGARSPLGAGAMAGQELPWDRERMAALLGFPAAERHALVAVASRGWMLDLAAECSNLGTGLSRFVTDLMAWSSGALRFADLPDELAGISSAMPQKKNFPVLERIRGRLAHLTSGYLDLVLTQRGTPFSNTVEGSKEGGSRLLPLCTELRSALVLLTTVLNGLSFDTDRMRNACASEYLGGFSLATSLTLHAGVPWRTAQVLAGRYISAVLTQGRAPREYAEDVLCAVAESAGYPVPDAGELLRAAFDPDRELRRRASPGGTAPDAVRTLLRTQAGELAEQRTGWAERTERQESVARQVDRLLAGDGTRRTGQAR
jgi:argininosuccinate lyase